MKEKSFDNLIKIKILSEEDSFKFMGYLSTFGNADRVGDVIEPGAFDKSLSRKNKATMLFNHNRNDVIGFLTMSVDEKGLKVVGEFDPDDSRSMEIYQKIKFGSLDEMSIGMRVQKYEILDPDKPWGAWSIKEVDILEGSVVSIPANTEATIDTVKSDAFDEVKLMKNQLIDEINATLKKY